MKSKKFFWVAGLLALMVALIPLGYAQAQLLANNTPPADMFQLPWEQGEAWIVLDGLDNGTRRGDGTAHDYRVGGAVDFTPNKDVHVGVDTSNFWVTATAAGTITDQSSCYIKINHGNGWITEYQHLDNLQVSLGEAVYRNQRLGVIADNIEVESCPGNKFPYPHLHYTLRPAMRDVTLAGWLIEYNPLLNRTSFTKNGVTISNWSYQPLLNIPILQIALRDPIIWNTIYIGTLDAYRYELWPFTITQAENFTLTATGTTAGLIPVIVLLDTNGNEIVRGTGSLTSTQPAGNYLVQVQPETGQGFYKLIIQQNTLPDDPSSSIVVPPSIDVGETSLVSVNLNNIPSGGYTAVEFTCSYPPELISISNITVTDLFGTNPAVAINGPTNGSFIVAIAGTNGQRATSDGTAFTFNVTGYQAGQVDIVCPTRISTGDGTLTTINSIGASFPVLGAAPTLTLMSAPDPGPTALTITGQVLAAKPVTIGLYDASNTLVASNVVNTDDTFSLIAPAGTYTVIATASGFLNAQGPAILIDGQPATKTPVSLPAGDIDGNSVIDQYDAISIGMNYNTASPDAADLNADGIINILDLETLAENYRAAGALDWQ